MSGLARTFTSQPLQDKAAVPGKPQAKPRRSHYAHRRRWSLRAAIPLWIGLAVAGWAAVIVSVYSFMRHENEVALIEKIERLDREGERLNTIAPASGPTESKAPQGE